MAIRLNRFRSGGASFKGVMWQQNYSTQDTFPENGTCLERNGTGDQIFNQSKGDHLIVEELNKRTSDCM